MPKLVAQRRRARTRQHGSQYRVTKSRTSARTNSSPLMSICGQSDKQISLTHGAHILRHVSLSHLSLPSRSCRDVRRPNAFMVSNQESRGANIGSRTVLPGRNTLTAVAVRDRTSPAGEPAVRTDAIDARVNQMCAGPIQGTAADRDHNRPAPAIWGDLGALLEDPRVAMRGCSTTTTCPQRRRRGHAGCRSDRSGGR